MDVDDFMKVAKEKYWIDLV
ncbi:hypothetical protein A584_25376 [Pseudomonas syringae pv. theae ICMP 3923]|nr:hypothetical protein A584_25376 [Pseudomonas syringae pv. theae ICMP 3923]